MAIGLLFWIVWLMVLFFGGYLSYQPAVGWRSVGGHGLTMLMFFLVGWRLFGFVVHN